MTIKKFALFAMLGVLSSFLVLEGTSWAPVMKTPDPMENFIKYPVIGEWTWFSPLEGVRYGMNQFADGTIGR
ncbi:MAG: hypothetical protein ACC669_03915 [bacterium]